ncbi:MAG: A24 family peptidase [Ramlibacter sp.]
MNDLHAIAELLSMLVLDARTGTLIALLVVAGAIDWRTSCIPNWLTVGGMVLGLAISASKGTSIISGLGHGAGGLALGLLLPMPLYAMRILGAGDVKLMATVGAFLGALLTLSAVLFSFMAGGILAIAWALAHGVLRRMVSNLMFIFMALLHPAGAGWRAAAPGSLPSVGRMPFGLGISVGTITFLLLRQFA